MRVEMLNDEGTVTETCEVHQCVGDPNCCQYPAECEDHGEIASADTPVYIWTTADGMTFAACADALASDDYAHLVHP